MGLLKHPNDKNYHNKNLDNPAQIKVKHEITPDNLNINQKPKKKKHVTIPVNIRVDNHVRNDITALIQLGYAKSNKDLVSQLVQTKVSNLSVERNKRFEMLKNILEQKDVLSYKVRHPKYK